MVHSILTLNYVAVLSVTVVGFLLGWLWHSPVLFAKAWMAELKFTEESMRAAAEKGMARFFIGGFVCTFLSTFGLAVLLSSNRTALWWRGALFGAFVGVFVVAMRMVNSGWWETRSFRLMAINTGHEILLYTVQGALLGEWR